MKATISFELIDKKIGDEDVAGLVGIDFDLTDVDHVRSVLLMIESIASPKIVIGFADASSSAIFEACGWLVGRAYEDQHLVASDAIDESKFDGNIW